MKPKSTAFIAAKVKSATSIELIGLSESYVIS